MIVSGHNSCWGTNVSGRKRVWAQTCLGIVMHGHNNYYCVGTNMPRHSHVWAQSCLGTIMHGHKRSGTGKYRTGGARACGKPVSVMRPRY